MKRIKKFIARVILAAAIVAILAIFIDFCRFPECYATTWKYQLENDIKRGNEQAIEYYESRYVANGRVLFD